MKTNAARILEGLGIAYTLQEYEVDPEDLSAISVARKIGLPVEQVFKTLLTTTGPDQYAFAVIPGDAELDFKKLARAAGARKAEMVSLKDVQPLTGYIRGGVTVFGAKKDFPVFADETIEFFDFISVSAGQRGTQILLAPQDYLRAANATVADLTKDQARLVSYLLIHLAKDLRLEWRSKDAINGMLFFALMVVVLFSLAFDPTAAISRQIAGGILCVATLFASVTALNQAWTRELRHQVLDAQRMAPAPPASLFLAKVIANFIFVTVVQIVLAPLFAIFYNLHPLGREVAVAGGSAAGHLGAGGEWNLLCRALGPHPEPRTAASSAALSHLHPGAAGHGRGDDRHPGGRFRTRRSGSSYSPATTSSSPP